MERERGGDIEVELEWEPGDDLGRCEFEGLVRAGVIPHPADVEVVRWEVVVEPDEDQVPEEIAMGVYSTQLPGHVREVEISEEFIEAYTDVGVTTFKFEVGAKEAGGNQTFFEGELEIE